MVTAAELTRYAIQRNGWTRTELARVANVSPSTVTRIVSGQMDPKWSTIQDLLSSAGYVISGADLCGLNDQSAVNSAVDVLSRVVETKSTTWVDRWIRAGFVDGKTRKAKRAEKVAVQAGLTCPIRDRAGAVRVPFNSKLAQALVAIEQSGTDFALSGIESLSERYENALPDVGNCVVYVDSVEGARKSLDAAGIVAAQERLGQTITLIPMQQLPQNQRDRRQPWQVIPERAVVDAYAGVGRDPDRADAYLSRIEMALA